MYFDRKNLFRERNFFIHHSLFSSFLMSSFASSILLKMGPELLYGGDCVESNKALQTNYPECTEVQYSTWIGDGKCDRQTNVEACGWDGGDCL